MQKLQVLSTQCLSIDSGIYGVHTLVFFFLFGEALFMFWPSFDIDYGLRQSLAKSGNRFTLQGWGELLILKGSTIFDKHVASRSFALPLYHNR